MLVSGVKLASVHLHYSGMSTSNLVSGAEGQEFFCLHLTLGRVPPASRFLQKGQFLDLE